MASLRNIFWALAFAVAALAAVASATPIFDIFGLNYPQQRPSRRPASSSGGNQRTGRERYKRICRAHNADPYAFPGRAPYPSAPLCPY